MQNDSVVVIGSINYDLFLSVERLPVLGETAVARDMQSAGGGKGANQAVQCAKLGMKTYMVGAVGRDFMGESLLADLQAAGVDTQYVHKSPFPSGMGIVHVLPDGNVFSTISRGANDSVTPEDVEKAEPLLKKAFALMLQLEVPTETVSCAIRTAHRLGVPVLLNAAPAKAIQPELFSLCDTVMVNEVEAGYYTGQVNTTIVQAMENIVPFAARHQVRTVFTLGALGAVACDRGAAPVHIPAVKTNAVETTGAGDSFAGGYLKAMSAGLSFTDCVRFAAHCSAVTVSRVGGQNAMPALEAVLPYLRTSN